jgi:hypothetical protein
VDFGDYIVYVDESGDHGLASIDPNYPIFVLAFCIFSKDEYRRIAVPRLLDFKFRHFGHDQVVLHEHEIRKKKNAFVFLNDPAQRDQFHAGLDQLMEATPFTLVAVVIRKQGLVNRYPMPANPYDLAIEYGLERVCAFLRERGQEGKLIHFVFERRGAREDQELELEFRRVCAPGRSTCRGVPVDIIMADKKTISTGLQLADLVARPIGLRILRPRQPNRAYETIEKKFRRGPAGQVDGWGLKCFP